LGVEEFFDSTFLPHAAIHICAGHFEIPLSAWSFDNSLASMVLCPDIVDYM
jgi:hypothetical protein